MVVAWFLFVVSAWLVWRIFEDGGGESWRVLDMGSLLSVEDGNRVLWITQSERIC